MMTPEQWNGLVALMRAISVASVKQSTATPGLDTDAMDAKRQAGACETNVRKMFVTDDTPTIATPAPGSTEVDRLLLMTADVCRFLDDIRTKRHDGADLRARAGNLLYGLELARVRVRQDHPDVKAADLPEEKKDTRRTIAASSAIFDGRMRMHASSIMVTLEHTVAAVLLALYGDPAKAAGMLNEALAPGIEARLAGYGAKPK